MSRVTDYKPNVDAAYQLLKEEQRRTVRGYFTVREFENWCNMLNVQPIPSHSTLLRYLDDKHRQKDLAVMWVGGSLAYQFVEFI